MRKPFDIRERAFLFACDILAAFPPARPLDPPSWRAWCQLIAAGTSVGAHLEEADAASSRAHFIDAILVTIIKRASTGKKP